MVKIKIKHEDILCIVMLILRIILRKKSEFEVNKTFHYRLHPRRLILLPKSFPFTPKYWKTTLT